MTSNKTLACRTHKHTPTYRMMFSRICGFSFASAATDVAVNVIAAVVASLVAAVVAVHILQFHVIAVDVADVVAAIVAAVVAAFVFVHVLHLHVVVGDAAHKVIAAGGGTTRSLGARENLQCSPEFIAATIVLQRQIPTLSNNSAPFGREYLTAGCRWTDCLSCGTVVQDGWKRRMEKKVRKHGNFQQMLVLTNLCC